MIKKLHEITIKDIIILDESKSAKSLKKYWLTPLWLYRKELEFLAKQIFESIGNKAINNIQDDFDKVIEYRKLQILEALYKALEIEIKLKSRINGWKLILKKDYKDSPQLEKVVSEVKRFTGIEIKEPSDFKTFEDYIQHKIDKYDELYPKNEDNEEKEVPLSKIIYSVFNYMSEPYKEDMRLITFIQMKKMAEERIKQTKKEDHGQDSGDSAD